MQTLVMTSDFLAGSPFYWLFYSKQNFLREVVITSVLDEDLPCLVVVGGGGGVYKTPAI